MYFTLINRILRQRDTLTQKDTAEHTLIFHGHVLYMLTHMCQHGTEDQATLLTAKADYVRLRPPPFRTPLLLGCLTAASRMPHGCLTAASWIPHGCLTDSSRMPHKCLTNASRMPQECYTMPHDCLKNALQRPYFEERPQDTLKIK